MDAIEFVNNYNLFVEEIETVIRPDYKIHIEKLKSIEPHDLVKANPYFMKTATANGYVWSLFLKEINSL
jgi:hypothetical protein